MRIEGEYIKTGYFWLPGKEENKIPGILKINDGGSIELEVVGLFDESVKALNGDDDLIRIIGHVESDGYVTLEKCFYTSKSLPFGGISKSKILVHQVLSGAAWYKDEEVKFNTLSFSVDCLDEWVGISGIKIDHGWEGVTAAITYSPPQNINFLLDNGMKLEICFAYSLPGGDGLKEAKITQQAYFKISSSSLTELSEFTAIAFKITSLMCFAMNETVSIKKLSATSSEIVCDLGDKKYPKSITIYYQSNPYVEKEPRKNWREMLFDFGTIKSNAEEIFNNWINVYEFLSPAIGLYFSTKNGTQKYLNGKFLALVQGLETYHRRTSEETLMESKVFDVLVNTILEGCPEDDVGWLKGRLMHGNEINLRKRIKIIIEPFKKHLGTSKERSKLLKNIVDTRNYLTHYDDALKSEAAKGRDLWVLCSKMELIFNLHFLKVIGFTDDEIDNVLENCRPLKRMVDQI